LKLESKIFERGVHTEYASFCSRKLDIISRLKEVLGFIDDKLYAHRAYLH